MGLNVIVHYPTTDEGWAELSKRVAEAHADLAIRKIQKLKCPHTQKLQLVDVAIETIRRREND